MIHQYIFDQYHIVLDVFSGSVHVMDEVAFAITALYEQETKEAVIKKMLEKYKGNPDVTEQELRECYRNITALKERGVLFSEDTFQDRAFDYKNRSNVIKALCLHVAHTCNLNCQYCFASQGKYKGERGLMSLAVGKRALDFLIEESGSRKNLEVDFFGGEPLMNWDVVKDLVAYGRQRERECHKKFRFTLTTNGVSLNEEVMEFANREMHNVVLSLDGRKSVHDHLRKNYAGQGSYDTIVPKFQELVKRRGGKNYYVRGTFTHNNTDFTEDIFHMADLGFRELSMEPVVCSPEEPYALTKEDLPVVFAQYELLAREMARRKTEGKGFTFYHYMLDLTGGPCIYKRLSGCGTGTEYMAVTPWGELFPCHQFVEHPEFSLGNVFDGVTNKTLQEEFRSCNIYARSGCDDCWAKLFCSGGCPANAFHATGSIKGTYDYGCALFRKRIECAIYLKIREAGL